MSRLVNFNPRRRFILGVGSGYQKAEFEALGVDFHRRGRLTDAAVETIREVWSGGKIVKKGLELYGDFDINIAISSVDNFVNRSQDEADQFIEDIQQLANIGVTWVTLKLPHRNRAAYKENVHCFGEEVVRRIV